MESPENLKQCKIHNGQEQEVDEHNAHWQVKFIPARNRKENIKEARQTKKYSTPLRHACKHLKEFAEFLDKSNLVICQSHRRGTHHVSAL